MWTSCCAGRLPIYGTCASHWCLYRLYNEGRVQGQPISITSVKHLKGMATVVGWPTIAKSSTPELGTHKKLARCLSCAWWEPRAHAADVEGASCWACEMWKIKDQWNGMQARCSKLKTNASFAVSRVLLLGSLIRRSPHVLMVPVVLLCIMVALGCWGVKTAVTRTIELERSTATVDADAASQALQLAIQRAMLPVSQLAEIVKLMPQAQLLDKQFPIAAPSIWLGASNGSLAFALTPGGVGRYVYPVMYAPFPSALLLGINTLTPPLRELMLQAVRDKIPSLIGPGILRLPDQTKMIAILNQPIFFANMSQSDTWDYKQFNDKLCPPGLCYNNETRTRWWGSASLLLDAMMLFGPDGPLSALKRKGYPYRLWHPPVPGFVSSGLQSIALAGFAGQRIDAALQAQPTEEMIRGLVPIAALDQYTPEPDDAIAVTLPVINQMWELHVWKDAWSPSWMLPLIAVVVLGAVLVSTLVFSTLCSWAEHRELLHSLLPEETIARMRHEAKWAATDGHDDIKTVRMETPAELMMRIIEDCIAGRSPGLPMLLSVRDALHRSADVYRPNEQQMRMRMQEQAGMDDDVRHALTAQLMGTARSPFAEHGDVPDPFHDKALKKAETSLDDESTSLASNSGLALFTAGSFVVRTVNASAVADDSWQIESKPESPQIKPKARASPGRSAPLDTMINLIAQRASLLGDDDLVTTPVDGTGGGELLTVLGSWLLRDSQVLHHVQTASYKAASAKPPQHVDEPIEAMAIVLRPIVTHLERVLVTADDWSFDAFALAEASHGRPLSCLGFWLLQSSGLKSWAHMSNKKLVRFLEHVESGYVNNPYHNACHAADVLQSVHVIMHRSGLVPAFADQLTLLGCYLSAMVHDLEHVGRTNDFLVNSSDELAIRYNDRSPMENHHLAAAWSLLKTKECNILSGLSAADVNKLRKLVIDLVLATDMKQHFAIQGQFETMARQVNEQATSEHGSSTKRSLSVSERQNKVNLSKLIAQLKPVNEQDQLLSLQMMLKCADLGSLSAPLPVYLRWVSALEAEMFLQGDEEKALGIPISPLCDRSKEGVTKAQIGFFDFVGVPLFKSFCARFTGAMPLLAAVLGNLAHWKPVVPGT